MSDNDAHLQNDARTCEAIDTPATQPDSRKVLAQMVKVYETALPSCKASMGNNLRQALRDINSEKANAGS